MKPDDKYESNFKWYKWIKTKLISLNVEELEEKIW